MAGRLRQPNTARDYGFKDLTLEEVSKIVRDLAGQIRTIIKHGEEDSFNFQRMLERISNALNCIHQFGYTFEGEEFALDRNEHGVGGDERIQGQEIQRRRAIDQNEIVLGAYCLYFIAQTEFTSGCVHQFQIGSDQILIAGDQIEAFKFSMQDGLGDFGPTQENMVQARKVGTLCGSHSCGGVALWIGIDYEDAEIVSSQGGGNINGGSGLPNAALLIRDGKNPAQAVMLARMVRAAEANLVPRETPQTSRFT